MKAVYPGSFDPVTFGHLDIIQRAAKVVDELIIGVIVNKAKKSPLFTLEERVAMLEEATKAYPNVTVKMFDGMTIDFARENGARLIIRGLRAVTDFESEMQIAQTNHSLDSNIDTMFFTTSLEYSFLSSTVVKEVASYGRDTSKFVPEVVQKAFQKKFQQH